MVSVENYFNFSARVIFKNWLLKGQSSSRKGHTRSRSCYLYGSFSKLKCQQFSEIKKYPSWNYLQMWFFEADAGWDDLIEFVTKRCVRGKRDFWVGISVLLAYKGGDHYREIWKVNAVAVMMFVGEIMMVILAWNVFIIFFVYDGKW